MKKLLTSLCLLLCAVASWGAKANSTPVTITQPDGTQLTVILHGDEHANWYTTVDGTLLVQQQRAYYVARVKADGSLTSTGLLAHSTDHRAAAELKAIAQQDKSAFYNATAETVSKARRVAIGTGADKHYFPHTGSPKALVLLVEFADTTFSLATPKESFDQYLNGKEELKNLGANEDKNSGSALQYFKAMSDGAFTPQFDVYGPYKMSQNSAVYGKGRNDQMDLLIPEACKAADADVNFADYDSDGDGYVDVVYIIYAGYSASFGDNSEDYIWPKSGTMSNAGTYDGVKVYRYGVNNELIASPTSFTTAPLKRINGLGLFIHEFSHTMGLPDLYPTTSPASTYNDQGMEFWSVMDGGENNYNGYYPTAYTAWEREVMGWYKPDTLTDTCTVADLAPLNDGGKAYKVFNGDTKEHVILENVQQSGWNKRLRGHGLLTYRISYSRNEVNTFDSPNNTAGKPEVVVLAADGRLKNVNNCQTASEYYTDMAGDPYPGTSNVTNIESFKMIDGTLLEKPVLNIKESAEGLITFDFLGKKQIVDAITAPTIVDNAPQTIYTLDGRVAGTDRSRLAKGIYIIGGKKFVKD